MCRDYILFLGIVVWYYDYVQVDSEKKRRLGAVEMGELHHM